MIVPLTSIVLESLNSSSRDTELFFSEHSHRSSSIDNITNSKPYSILTSENPDECLTTIKCNNLNIVKISKSVFYNYNRHVLSVTLNKNKLRKISKHFLNFENLQILSLNDNDIVSIPVWICKISQLSHLSLEKNQIDFFPIILCKVSTLTYLNLSYNKIKKIPSEISNLKKLATLNLTSNYFDKLPTSISEMKNLKDFHIEWYEFCDTNKETYNSMVELTEKKTNLNSMFKGNRNKRELHSITPLARTKIIFRLLFSKGQNYISFTKFIALWRLSLNHFTINERNDFELSTRQKDKISPLLLNSEKIFYALRSNYYGVLSSLIKSDKSLLEIKNKSNKTLLYASLTTTLNDITQLLISHINISSLHSTQLYVFKAIKLLNVPLVSLLIEKMSKKTFLFCDDNRNNCFHLLFNNFYKNEAFAMQICGLLLEKTECSVNLKNKLGWAPIHIAVKKGRTIALKFLYNCNKHLNASNKNEFNFNKKGKEKWTPLHLAVNDYKIEESIFLVKVAKCDLFIKNANGLTPRGVCDGNYLLSRFLIGIETEIFYMRYITQKGTIIITEKFKVKADQNNSKNILVGYCKLLMINDVKDGDTNEVENEIKEILRDCVDEDESDNSEVKISVIDAICDIMMIYNLKGVCEMLESIVSNYKIKNRLILLTIENAISLMKMFSKFGTSEKKLNAFISAKLPKIKFYSN